MRHAYSVRVQDPSVARADPTVPSPYSIATKDAHCAGRRHARWPCCGNSAREGGRGIFFVVDNNQGTLTIKNSTLHNNPSDEFSTAGFPGIFFHSSGHPILIDSTLS